MSKIIKALKQAVKFARGDKSAGRSTVILYPTGESALEMAKAGRGQWVSHKDMNAVTNISGRVFRDSKGNLHVWHSFGMHSDIQDWFFPHRPD